MCDARKVSKTNMTLPRGRDLPNTQGRQQLRCELWDTHNYPSSSAWRKEELGWCCNFDIMEPLITVRVDDQRTLDDWKV